MRKTSDVIWQDAQHQTLFDLLDQIAEDSSGIEVLDRLKFYAESHFVIEEKYMEELNYPGFAEHLAAHDKFRLELADMMDNPGKHDATSRQIISTFLTEWLKRHVFGIDKKLELFIFESNAR